jgi:redox-sensing transcriptional repressor
MEDLPGIVESNEVKLAIVAVPAEAAQDVADRLKDAGIMGVLNFAPAPIDAPPHVSTVPVDLAARLEQLSFLVGQRAGARGQRAAAGVDGEAR